MRPDLDIGSPPDNGGLSPEPNQSTSDDARPIVAEQACRECRRRKSKCDRIVPICHLCGKFNRRCTYEKFTRTPLTRTYLTKVESELARTKALLRQLREDSSNENPTSSGRNPVGMGESNYNVPQAQQFLLDESVTASHQMPMPAESISPQQRVDSDTSTHRVDPGQNELSGLEQQTYAVNTTGTSFDAPRARRFISGESTGPSNTIFNYDGDNTATHPGNADASTLNQTQTRLSMPGGSGHAVNTGSIAFDTSQPVLGQAPRRNMRPSSVSQSVGTSSFLETPPSASNFEWDERTGGASAGRFVDGMASLTSRSNEGGYLGSASGAALLRLTDTRSADDVGSYDDMNTDYHRQPSIPFSLNSMSQLEPFIDAYFSIYHCSYPIVHEATFRAQFMEIIPRPSGNAWQVLLFVMSAVGVFASASQPTDVDLALFDAAKARLSIDVLESGNLVLVQALTLISNYLQKRNKPNSGYNYMGLARRVAMGIGLHKEFPTWDASLLTLEMRRRVWYCLYIFDIGAIITFSRPFDFPEDGVDVHLPLNTHDSDITAGTKRAPLPAQETTIYTHLRAQATFHIATSHIYSKLISLPLPSAAEMIELDDQCIGKWLAELPAFFQENAIQPPKFRLCHAIMRWRYRNFQLLMYRPFLVGRLMARIERGPDDDQVWGDAHVGFAIERCLSAAHEAIRLISTFWMQEQRTMMACWYGLYFLFQAVLIPVICLRNDPQSPLADGWRGQVLQAVEVLELMVSLNPTAKRCLGVIQSLCGAYLHPTVDGWGRPTEESPQTQLANLYPLMWPTLEIGQLDGGDSIIQESTIMDFMSRLPGLE